MSWRRLLGFAPVCGPMPSAYFWPRNRSCLGLCLLQGCRARLPCIAIGHDPDRIINLRRPTHPRYAARPRSPIRSWVFGVLPDRNVTQSTREVSLGLSHIPVVAGQMLLARAASPSLQRIDGADASPTRPVRGPEPGKLPV